MKNEKSKKNKLSTKINDLKLYDDIETPKTNKNLEIGILLSIIGLTFFDLLLFITQSSLVVLYIPIMIIVFSLLFVYNCLLNNMYIQQIGDKIIFTDKKKFSHIVEIKKINEIRNKDNKITLVLDENKNISFKINNSKIIYEELKKGIL